MRKIREVLRLKFELRLSDSQIARTIGSARSTVQECVRRANEAGLSWPLPSECGEAQLHARLYRRNVPLSRTPAPDFAALHAELRRPGVTRLLLWQEYKAAQPDGWQYSVFCEQYRRWLATQDAVLRQHHTPGDKCFVDYAGDTVGVVDRTTGEIRDAQIFVAVLGASSYTFAEATWTQQVSDWLGSHERALQFFGGVPRTIVPDNLKSGVTKAHRYEPDLNPAYQDFAEHYGLAILPARVRKPRDKAKVEAAVQVVQRWILARLRHRRFFSLAELNAASEALLRDLNTRLFKRRDGSRQQGYQEIDRPALRPLPAQPYAFATWKKAKAHVDYHTTVRGIASSALAQVRDLSWIDQHLNLLITGLTGVGKSFVACALAHAACRADHAVRFLRLPRLIDEFTRAHSLQNRSDLLKQLAKVELLVLDDFGLTPLSDQTKRDLLELLDDRYDRRSTIVISQLPVDQWHTYLGDPTLADAILGRVVHNAYRLNLSGESMRKHKTVESKTHPTPTASRAKKG